MAQPQPLPLPQQPTIVPVVPQVYPDTTLDLMYAILTAFGGNMNDIDQKYFDTGDDLLYAILKKIVNGGFTVTTITPILNGVVDGSAIWSGTGLIYDVTVCHYVINGSPYSSPAASVELDPADPTNPRFDVIALNDQGETFVITGDPSPDPIKPVIDPAFQCELTFILVAPGSTEPGNIRVEDIYHENVEWLTSGSSNVNFDYTSDPHLGVKSIRGNTGAGTYFSLMFQGANILNAGDYQFLIFYIKLISNPASLDTPFVMRINLVLGNTVINSGCLLTSAYGFDPAALDVWQLISVPFATMNFSSQNFDRLYLNVFSPQPFELDDIVLQGPSVVAVGSGSAPQNLQQVTDEGNTTTNDVIVTDGINQTFMTYKNKSVRLDDGDSITTLEFIGTNGQFNNLKTPKFNAGQNPDGEARVLVQTVNGVEADAFGNVDVAGGGGADYLEEEHALNVKWVDGKPIFRKVILFSPAVITDGLILSQQLALLNIDTMVSMNALCNDENGDLSTGENTSAYAGLIPQSLYFASSSNKDLLLVCDPSHGEHYGGHVIIEYTKN